MSENRSDLRNWEAFGSMDKFRHLLNSVQSLADFSIDSAQGPLIYADEAELQNLASREKEDTEEFSDREFDRIRTLAHARKRYRMNFIKGPEGRQLRLSKRSHEQMKSRPAGFCDICGTQRASGTYKPLLSTFKCKFCDVISLRQTSPGPP